MEDAIETEVAKAHTGYRCTCEYYWHNPQDHDASCPERVPIERHLRGCPGSERASLCNDCGEDEESKAESHQVGN